MSLRIWLPLNGNLNNQGLSGITMTGSPNSWGDGKIGKCATFVGTIANAITNDSTSFNYTDNFSWSLWINTNYTGTSGQYAFTVGRADAGGYGYGLQCTKATTCLARFGNASYSIAVTSGQWTHLVFTKKGNIITIYKNGQLDSTNTFSGTLPTYSDGKGIGIGCFHYSSGNIYPFYGSLNDVRLYDHCLSAKEVKEISKGLILHYKLSGIGGENLVTDSQHLSNVFSMAGTSTWTRSYVTEGTQQIWKATCTVGGTGGVHTPLFPKTADKIGKKYTYSVKVKANKNVSVNIGSECGGLKAQDVTTSWKTFTYTWTFTDGTYSSFVWYTPSVNWATGDWIMVKDLKIEEGDKATPWCPHTSDALYTSMGLNNNIEYDLSGYKNNGTKANSFKYVSDSVRYTGSYDMSSALSNINLPDIKYETMKQGTIAFWLKVPNNFNYWTHYLFLANSFNWTGKESDFILVANNSELSSATTSMTINLDCCSYINGFTANVNTWYFVAITWNKDTYKITKYVNGSLLATNDDSSAKRLDTYSSKHNRHGIGNITQNNNHQGNKLLNDFRIYATALSADDIKELYQTAALIDNKGNAYAYEFVEA